MSGCTKSLRAASSYPHLLSADACRISSRGTYSVADQGNEIVGDLAELVPRRLELRVSGSTEPVSVY